MRRCMVPLVLAAVTALLPAPARATAFPVGYNPGAGARIVNPDINCHSDVEGVAADLPAGIIIDDRNTTIINPEISNCETGIMVQPKNGVVPKNVRIIASAAYPGYAQTIFLHDRNAIRVKRVIGMEIGDVSAPANQIGGELYFENDFRYFHGNGGIDVRIHHTTSACGACALWEASSTSAPGAMWGFKWLADRTLGPPQQVRGDRIDHNIVDGFSEEGISFDSRANVAAMRSNAYGGTVTSRSPGKDRVTLSGYTPTESLVGMFVTFNEGAAKGRSPKILSGRTSLRVKDRRNVLSHVAAGNRATIGMRFYRNTVDHNRVHARGAKTGIDFHGSTTFSRLNANTVFGAPSYDYPAAFHIRIAGFPQCMMVRSLAGPGPPAFSMDNSIVGNMCDSSGDISATVVSWGAYEVASPTWISGNVFTGTPTGQVWRHKAPQERP